MNSASNVCTASLKGLPSLSWPGHVNSAFEGKRQLVAHQVIAEVTDAFDRTASHLAALDNKPATRENTADDAAALRRPECKDYNTTPGTVVVIDQTIGDGTISTQLHVQSAELDYNPENGTVKSYRAIIDHNDELSFDSRGKNPTFTRVQDGQRTVVSFDPKKQIITQFLET